MASERYLFRIGENEVVNETAPISEHSYIEDTAEAPVEDVAVEETAKRAHLRNGEACIE